MGLLTPWSHVPHMLLSYTDNMSFQQRFYNVILSMYEWCYRNWVALPAHNKIAKEFFGFLEGSSYQMYINRLKLKNNNIITFNLF